MTRQPNHTLNNLRRAIFWVSFPFGILAFVLPIYGTELGASATEVGGLFSALFALPVVIRPFLGRALDRWGRRPFFLAGLLGYGLSIVMFCFTDDIISLTIARFIQGLGQAFLWLSAYTIVADVAAEKGRGHDFGTVDEAVNRGGLVGTGLGFLAMVALELAGLPLRRIWPFLFAFYTIPALISIWVALRGVQETLPRAPKTPIESHPVSPQLLALMGIVFFTGASSTMLWPLLVVFLQDILHTGIIGLAMAYLPAALINAFMPSRMGRIADRFGRKAPMVTGLLTGAFVSGILPHLRSLFSLSALWAAESLSYTAATPAERAFVADVAGEDTRGTSYGLYTFAFFLGAAVGPLVGGWLYDHTGHIIPFYLNTLILAIGAVLVATVLRESVPQEKSDDS